MKALEPRRGAPVAVARFDPGGAYAPRPIHWAARRDAPATPPQASAVLVGEVLALGDLLQGLARAQAATADAHARWMRDQADADVMIAELAARLGPR